MTARWGEGGKGRVRVTFVPVCCASCQIHIPRREGNTPEGLETELALPSSGREEIPPPEATRVAQQRMKKADQFLEEREQKAIGPSQVWIWHEDNRAYTSRASTLSVPGFHACKTSGSVTSLHSSSQSFSTLTFLG